MTDKTRIRNVGVCVIVFEKFQFLPVQTEIQHRSFRFKMGTGGFLKVSVLRAEKPS